MTRRNAAGDRLAPAPIQWAARATAVTLTICLPLFAAGTIEALPL